MKTAVFAFSRQGCRTARRIMAQLPGSPVGYTLERFGEEGFDFLTGNVYEECFHRAQALVFVGSCGIALRKIAPYIRDKQTDPAVLVVDELGQFVIPILSGHIGGANALAQQLAQALGATPVITTATDINHRFSVDSWAARQGLVIGDIKAAKAISAAILEGEVPLRSDFPVVGPLPNGVCSGLDGPLGIFLSYTTKMPFDRTLHLIPRVLHLGIGCRKGTGIEAIARLVQEVLEENGLDPRAVKCVASIDLKAGEAGLLAFCEARKLPISFYPAEELCAVEGDFTPSEFVRSITGVDNVCERAALLGAQTLIVKKQARDGVTVAVAAESWEVRFE